MINRFVSFRSVSYVRVCMTRINIEAKTFRDLVYFNRPMFLTPTQLDWFDVLALLLQVCANSSSSSPEEDPVGC